MIDLAVFFVALGFALVIMGEREKAARRKRTQRMIDRIKGAR